MRKHDALRVIFADKTGDKNEEATVHFQWSELCRFHKNILYLNFAVWASFLYDTCISQEKFI